MLATLQCMQALTSGGGGMDAAIAAPDFVACLCSVLDPADQDCSKLVVEMLTKLCLYSVDGYCAALQVCCFWSRPSPPPPPSPPGLLSSGPKGYCVTKQVCMLQFLAPLYVTGECLTCLFSYTMDQRVPMLVILCGVASGLKRQECSPASVSLEFVGCST